MSLKSVGVYSDTVAKHLTANYYNKTTIDCKLGGVVIGDDIKTVSGDALAKHIQSIMETIPSIN